MDFKKRKDQGDEEQNPSDNINFKRQRSTSKYSPKVAYEEFCNSVSHFFSKEQLDQQLEFKLSDFEPIHESCVT